MLVERVIGSQSRRTCSIGQRGSEAEAISLSTREAPVATRSMLSCSPGGPSGMLVDVESTISTSLHTGASAMDAQR